MATSEPAVSNVVGPAEPAVAAGLVGKVEVPHGPPADHNDLVLFASELLVVGAFLLLVLWRSATW